jgi:hypothetical protein
MLIELRFWRFTFFYLTVKGAQRRLAGVTIDQSAVEFEAANGDSRIGGLVEQNLLKANNS